MIAHSQHDPTKDDRGSQTGRSLEGNDRLYRITTNTAESSVGELRSRLLQLIIANEQSRKEHATS